MKRKLLLLGAVLLTSMASMAQGWVAPTYTAQELVTSTEGVDSTFYYIYNVEAKAFLAAGYDWGTRACLGNPPQKFYITENEDGSYILHNYRRDQGKWDELFILSDSESYIDCSNRGNRNWVFDYVDGESNIFRLYGADSNETYTQEYMPGTCYFGYEWYEGITNHIVYPYLNVEDIPDGSQYMVNWMLVSVEEYESKESLMATYKAAMELETALAEAAEWYPEINLTCIQAVYNNTSSTLEELNAAAAKLKAAEDLLEFIFNDIEFNYPNVNTDDAFTLLQQDSFTVDEVNEVYDAIYAIAREQEVYETLDGATADDPRDATSLIKNSDFSAGDISGWDNTFVEGVSANHLGYQGASHSNGDITISQFMEAWAESGTRFNPNCLHRAIGDGQLSQTLKGLPAGKYVLGADVIAAYEDNGDLVVKGVQLFATGGSVDLYTDIHTRPYAPEHVELTFISDGGNITLGLRASDTDANWIAADNFTLVYYGPVEKDPYQVILEDLIVTYEAEFPGYGEDAMAYNGIKEAYKAEVEKAQKLTEGFTEEMEPLAAAYNALKASVAEYETFAELIHENEQKQVAFEESYPELAGLLEDLRMEWEDAYSECTADSAYIAEAKTALGETISNYITSNMTAGDDISALIVNPSFDNAFDGWQYTGSKPGWAGKKSNQNGSWYPEDFDAEGSGNLECWMHTFDLYQWVYNLPKGSYVLTCQAFERNENGNEDYWAQGPEAGINAVVYAGDAQTKVPNINAFATEDEYFAGGDWYDDVYSSCGYVPNGQTGANYRFAHDPEAYLVKVYFTIENEGDSVKIGIKTDATSGWVCWDNFRLIYNGEGAEAYEEAIDEQIAKLETVFDYATYYGADAQEKVANAIVALTAAKNGANPDACVEALQQGKDAYAYANESMTAYNNLYTAYDEFIWTAEEYAEMAPEAYQDACTLIETIGNGIEDGAFTLEEVNALQQQIKDVCDAFLKGEAQYYADDELPEGYEDATAENPVDFTGLILNPDFSLGHIGGWTNTFVDGETANHLGYQSSNHTNGEIVISQFMEAWAQTDSYYNPNCEHRAIGDGELKQTIKNLPAGVYVLAADVVAAFEDDYNLQVQGAQLFATSGSGDFYTEIATQPYAPQHFELTFVSDGGDITIGLRSINTEANWIAGDNFKLFYLGTETPVAINTVEQAKTAAAGNAIYNLAGQKLTAPQKGLNIINGKKIFIK